MTKMNSRPPARGWDSLSEPVAGNPARKVGSNRPRKAFAFVSSAKMGGRQYGESILEAENLDIHEADPMVLAYYPQPSTLSIEIEGEARRYTPDVLVERRDGTRVVQEVKTCEELGRDEVKDFLKAVSAEFRARGYEFETKTEEHIRKGVTYENAQLLLSHRLARLSPDFLRELGGAFAKRPVWTMDELREALGLERWKCSSMLNAMRLGHAVVDINLPLGADSLVYAPTEFVRMER